LEGVVDTYQPGTLPPRLYQAITSQFSRPQDDEDLGGNVHELVGHEVPATMEERRQMEEEEAEGEAFSQAIENCTRAGRARKAIQKALEGPKSGQRGRGGRGGGRGQRDAKV